MSPFPRSPLLLSLLGGGDTSHMDTQRLSQSSMAPKHREGTAQSPPLSMGIDLCDKHPGKILLALGCPILVCHILLSCPSVSQPGVPSQCVPSWRVPSQCVPARCPPAHYCRHSASHSGLSCSGVSPSRCPISLSPSHCPVSVSPSPCPHPAVSFQCPISVSPSRCPLCPLPEPPGPSAVRDRPLAVTAGTAPRGPHWDMNDWDITGISLGHDWNPTGILMGHHWDPTGILLGPHWDLTGT